MVLQLCLNPLKKIPARPVYMIYLFPIDDLGFLSKNIFTMWDKYVCWKQGVTIGNV